MREYQFDVRVRYAETDQMGVVYHGNYAQYLNSIAGKVNPTILVR